MYFGKSKNTGNYTFSFTKGMLDKAVEISDEQHRILINCSDDEMWSADENGNPIGGDGTLWECVASIEKMQSTSLSTTFKLNFENF